MAATAQFASGPAEIAVYRQVTTSGNRSTGQGQDIRNRGVGESGTGSYHGRYSFDAFVHRRSIVATPGWAERALSIRYPPYAGKLDGLLKSGPLKPDFDREGRKNPTGVLQWVVWFLTFGGGANKSGVARTAAVIIG